MPYMSNNELQKAINALSKLNVDKYVRKAKGKCEENVKNKIVITFLELVGYDKIYDMDFEHNVQNKKADIAIMLDGKPKMLIETKDIDEDLNNHINQGLAYAYGKGIEWVVLTNGIEFRIYKSFVAGLEPKDRLLFKTNLIDLPKTFDTINDLIGKNNLREAKNLNEKVKNARENITAQILIEDLTGCRELLFESLISQFKSRYKIDSVFKKIIDEWASSVKMDSSDPDFVGKLCYEGAYTLINRVLFLRICEDRKYIKPKLSKDAIKQWRRMVEKPSIFLNMAFSEIGQHFENLYSSPLFDSINFSDIEWDEKTIIYLIDRLGEHDFSKISKDILGKAYEQHISREERKRLGQFYTPDFVINYILDHVNITTEKKILDPACGSGGFLIKLHDRLKKEMMENDWDETEIHKHILKNNLFGIDINPFATQLTVMNLLLKDLDNPFGEMNIVQGNSLEKLELALDLDIYEKDSPLSSIKNIGHTKISLSKLLKNRPFDAIVSNPPYIFTRSMALSKDEKAYYKKQYKTAQGKINTFALFIESGIERLCEGGKLGFIVPNTLLRVSTYEPLRALILKTCAIEQIVDLGKGQFDDVTAETIILILRKVADDKERAKNKILILTNVKDLLHGDYDTVEIAQKRYSTNPQRIFNIFGVDRITTKLLTNIEKDCKSLGEITEEIIAGISTYEDKGKYISDKRLDRRYKPLLDGKDIGRYKIVFDKKYILYDKEILQRSRSEEIFLSPIKILIQRISGGVNPIVATIDTKQYYTFVSLNNIILKKGEGIPDARYVLAILNSRLMNYYFQNRFTNKAELTVNISKGYLELLPIKIVSNNIQDKIAKLVDKRLKLAECDQPGSTVDSEINQLIYEVYDITLPKEIEIIEKATAEVWTEPL